MVDDRDKKADYDFATVGESAPGRIATGHMSAEHGQNGTTKKDKERDTDSTADLLQHLNDFRHQLCAQIDMFQALLDDLKMDTSIAVIALRFHRGLAQGSGGNCPTSSNNQKRLQFREADCPQWWCLSK